MKTTIFSISAAMLLASCAEIDSTSGTITKPVTYQGINFGIDGGQWTHDFECDDPRFEGIGMTETVLLEIDTRMDATDCLNAFKAGNLQLRK